MTIQLGVFRSTTHCNQWRQLHALNGTDYWLAPMPVLMAEGWVQAENENKTLAATGKPRLRIREIIARYGITTTPKDLLDALDGPERLAVRLIANYGQTVRSYSRADVDLYQRRYMCHVPGRCFICQHSDGYAVMIERDGQTIKGGVLTHCIHTEWTA